MTREKIVSQLKAILIEDLFVELPQDAIGLDDGLQSVIGLDSVSFVELRVLCERHFDIEISDDDFSPEHFSSINRITDLIVRKHPK